MQLRLTRLVLITCLALLGIIGLQVFWLWKAYREQEKQLLSVVDNTLMETQIFTGVNASLRHTARSLASDILVDMSEGKFKRTDSGRIAIQKKYEINAVELFQNDSNIKSQVMALVGLDTSGSKSYTLQEYKGILAKSLASKKVDIPFELALTAADGSIIDATVDTMQFNKSGIITGTEYTLPITLNKNLTGRARLAFPHAAFYLLKGMWVILVLSLCLIFICAFSFAYMVALFYRQKKVAEIRNDFMNNMTHELKTPISSVSVALELLQDKSVSMEQEARNEYFAIAGNELNRLTMLVDKVLRMAAFEKMEVKIRKEQIAAQPWIESVMYSVKPLAEAGKIAMSITVLPQDLFVWADKGHLSSMLQNLLENAIKYADRNKSILEINISAKEENGMFILTVKDNGIGIAGQYQHKVFEKFFRVPTGDQHDTKGYGLGLSYVKEIVRLHNGQLHLQSELKTGTTFTIMIPQND